jgi:hypothetical protein
MLEFSERLGLDSGDRREGSIESKHMLSILWNAPEIQMKNPHQYNVLNEGFLCGDYLRRALGAIF